MTADAVVSTEAPAAYLERYGLMLLIRQFESEMQRLFLKGEVHGTTHLSAGQEAVPVGVCSALEPDDYLAGTYRGHGHALAKGTDPDALIAEMLGRATGVCGGRAGSMNVIDIERGLVGCFGIVGGSIAAATGAALAAKRQGRVAVAMFGDGATRSRSPAAVCSSSGWPSRTSPRWRTERVPAWTAPSRRRWRRRIPIRMRTAAASS